VEQPEFEGRVGTEGLWALGREIPAGSRGDRTLRYSVLVATVGVWGGALLTKANICLAFKRLMQN